ncbi:MAG: phosphoadenosine phosphosulfate reductase family protein [Christensenellales bacterium]
MKHTKSDLQQMQSLPLSAKIIMTKQRIKAWYDYFDGQVYVSFSGGKDSTVLLHIARELYPDIEAVFVNTGLEYPEIQKFVKTFDNVTILRPKMRFDEVITKYGYPIISKEVSECVYQGRLTLERADGKYSYRLQKLMGTAKDKNGNKSIFNKEKYKPLLYTDFMCSHYCCNIMKKKPAKEYAKKSGKKPITAQMASESHLREQQWLKNGCNGFKMKSPISNPMSFWTEQDVLQCIKENHIPIASVYGDIVYKENPDQMRIEDYGINGFGDEKLCTTGCDRTGCIFCAFGAHLEEGKSRFERLKETPPRQYEYCIGGGEYVDGVWQPSKEGLGMGHVFDELNEIYGDDFIRY